MRGSDAVKEAERIIRDCQRLPNTGQLPTMDLDAPALVQEDGAPYTPTIRARIAGWLRWVSKLGGRW